MAAVTGVCCRVSVLWGGGAGLTLGVPGATLRSLCAGFLLQRREERSSESAGKSSNSRGSVFDNKQTIWHFVKLYS